MKIGTKLVLGFVLISLVIGTVGFFFIQFSENRLRQIVGSSSVSLAEEALDKIDRYMHSRVVEVQALTSRRVLQQALIQSNNQFKAMPDVQAYINGQDETWKKQAKDVVTPFMNTVIETDLSDVLRESMEFYEEKYDYSVYGELFVTNRYGANVAQTGKTSDYRQDDERWWQKAKENGYFVDEINFDESAGLYSIDICVRVDDEKGNFIGVIKAVLNAKELLAITEEIKTSLKYKTGDLSLLKNDGTVLISTKEATQRGAQMLASHRELLTEQDKGYFIIENETVLNAPKRLCAYSQSTGYSFFQGLGWILILEVDLSEIFMDIDEISAQAFTLLAITLLLAIAASYFFSRAVASPVEALRKAVDEMRGGKFDQELPIMSRDEIGELTVAFNEMAGNLQSSIAKDKALAVQAVEAEVEKRKSQELRAMNEDLKKEIQQRLKTEEELKAYNQKIEKINRLMVGRELRMIELKQRLKQVMEDSDASENS